MVLPVLVPSDAVAHARLAQRLAELLQRRSVAVGEPKPARAVDATSLDPRLPSRRGLEGLAQAGTAGPGPAGPGRSAAPPAEPALALSAAARALAPLLYRGDGAETPPVRAAAPLWPAAGAPKAASLAQALVRAVGESGLFYESHLQDFAGGMRALAQLRHEPQAALPAAGSAAAEPVLHPATTELVRQQLDLIESGLFRWSGEAWPGASLEWDIRDERGQPDGPPDETPGAWSTLLRLALPALGAVEARLSLDAGGALRVRVAASGEAAGDWLQAQRTELLLRLHKAGTNPIACEIGAAP